LPSQFAVQPVPHVRSHVFEDWQSKVTPFGGATPPSADPSPPLALADPPSVHVWPA
jgi:hypothetical protein